MREIIGGHKTRSAKANGRNDFHVKCISWSYRIRGRDARIQINKVAMVIVLIVSMVSFIRIRFEFPKKKIADRRLIIIILAYSAMKIKAKDPALYSVLNPDTSSDSPSAKSNGVRFVSAKVVVNQIKASGINMKIGQEVFLFIMIFRSREETIVKVDRRIRAILTS